MNLRKWQQEAFPIWWKNKSGILKVVTGGGKTFFALHCIEIFLKEFPNKNVLIVVPSIPLLDQWSIESTENLNFSSSVNGGGFRLKKIDKINITTLGSLKNIIKDFKQEDTLLIVDECHKLGTPIKGNMLNKKWFATMGLSATPEREFDDYFSDIISPILGKIIFDYNYVDASKDGVITDFCLINAFAPMIEDESEDYDDLTKKISKRIGTLGGFDKSDQQLKILFFKRARIVNESINRIPLAINILKNFSREKWLIFSETKKQANDLNYHLNKQGFRSEVYNSDLGTRIRHSVLRQFKDGILDVVVSCKCLDEGFDLPDIDGALILSGSTTIRQRIQRMGRALRKSKSKDNALIATIYSSDDEYLRLKTEAENLKNQTNVKITWTKIKINER